MSFLNTMQNLFKGSNKNVISPVTNIPKTSPNPTRSGLDTSIYGVIGTWLFGGQFQEEMDAELRDLYYRQKSFDRMFRTDCSVPITHKICTTPIVAANYEIVALDSDKNSLKALDLVKKVILEDNNKLSTKSTFKRILKHAIQYKGFGFSAFEKNWRVIDETVVLEDMSPRLQRTLRFNTNYDGSIRDISQMYLLGNTPFWNIAIPTEKMVFFTNEMRGSDLEGIGLFRHQYYSWKIKTQLMDLLRIGYKRFLVGTLEGQVPEIIDEEDEKMFAQILKNWKSDEKGSVITPIGYDIKIHEAQFTGAVTALKYLDWLDRQIYLAGFAQFILLGQGSGRGSQSLSQDQTEFLRLFLQEDVDYVCEVFNFIIQEMIWYNFGDTVRCPVMRGRVEEMSFQQLVDNINKVVKNEIIPVYDELQVNMADKLHLPQPSKPFSELMKEQKKEFDKNKVIKDVKQGEKNVQND